MMVVIGGSGSFNRRYEQLVLLAALSVVKNGHMTPVEIQVKLV